MHVINDELEDTMSCPFMKNRESHILTKDIVCFDGQVTIVRFHREDYLRFCKFDLPTRYHIEIIEGLKNGLAILVIGSSK